jgi:hypothetical protein
VLASIWVPNTGMDHLAVLSAETQTVRGTRSDSPRPGAGASPPLRTSEWSMSGAWTARDGAEGLLRNRPRSRLL